MANKYHISPESGRPNICRAEKQCPIGGADNHYASKDEARAAFEQEMSAEVVAPVAKKRGRPKKIEVEAVEVIDPFVDEVELEEDFNGLDYGLPEEPNLAELEEVSVDDDWSDIKCDDCGKSLNNCSCGECEYCGAYEGDEHYEDCVLYKPKAKAYSWDD